MGTDAVASVTQTASGSGVAATGVAQAGTFTVTPSAAVLSTGLASNYGFSYVAATSTVDKATLTVSGSTAVNKIYDGSAVATLSGGTLQGLVGTDSSTVTLNTSGTFASKNVGNNIAVTSTSTLSGAGSGNYTLTQPTGLSANITRLNSVTWTGGATGDWLNPANWAGGAVPDLSNVANVVIPAGTTVSFNNVVTGTAQAGTVNVDGISGSTGSLTVSAGTLNVGTSGVTLSNLTQTGGSFSTQGAMTVGSGSIAVSAANYSLGTVNTSGAFSVTNAGGDVTLTGNVTGGSSELLIKSTGNIVQNTSTTVSTSGGNVTYWADSDANGAGSITLTAAGASPAKATISAATGHVVLGGGNGATAAGGAAIGSTGVLVGNHASISGANITLVGRGTASSTSGTYGVQIGDSASVVGSGSVSITGTGGGGSAISNSSNNIGVLVGASASSTAATVETTGANATVTITGTGGGTGSASLNNFGVRIAGVGAAVPTVRTRSGALGGSLTIQGNEGAGSASYGLSLGANVMLGGASQTGDISLVSNDIFSGSLASAITLKTDGAVSMAPVATSFRDTQTLGTNVVVAGASNSGPSALTIGKANNTAALTLYAPMSVAGPISLMAGDMYLESALASTGTGANGLISLAAYGAGKTIQQSALPPGLLTTPQLAVTGADSGVSLTKYNAIGTAAVTGATTVALVNAGPLTIGAVGSVSGISASSRVFVASLTGDLTVARDITTSSTLPSAINIEAGYNANPGDSTGGNIVLTNASTISVGAGGTAKLYTGSLAGSTSVAALVGSGSGRFRYGSDSLTSNYSQALSPGLSLIYRQQPTVSWSTQSDQSIAYGQAMSYSSTGSLNTYSTTSSHALGLQNGDEAKVSQALLVRTGSTPKANAKLNASNVYDVGVYEVSKTASAEALGYAASNPKITVTPAALTITANDASKTYDGGAYALGNGVSYNGFVAGENASALGGKAVFGGVAQGAVNAGTYALTVSGLTAKNYSISYSPGTLTVNPKALTIRVNDDARFVGQSDTVGYAGASYTGFVPGESISTLGSLSITRSTGSAAGTFVGALQASIPGLTNTNYAITYVPGNYTIVPADQLLVKFSNVATTYGADPVYALTSAQYLKSSNNVVIDLTSRASVTGTAFSLTDGDGGSTSFHVGVQSASLSSARQLNAFGGYQLGASNVTNSSTNYGSTITTTGALTVNPKTVSAAVGSGLTKTYDGNASMPGMSLALSGALAGDKVSVTGQGAYASANAGTTNYGVNNLTLSGVDRGNYVLSAGNGISGSNGAITKAALTVTAQSDRKIYDGEAYLGGNGVAYSGLVNNENSTVLGGALSYGGTSQNAVNAGTYTITPQGLTSNNYNITYVSAPLTVNPATITTSSVNALLQGPITKVYDGNASATLTSANYILSGWVGTDAASVTKTSGTYDDPNVGSGKLVTVNLTPSDYLAGAGTNLSNYVLPTSVSGAVGSITPKPVTVSGLTAVNKTYDGNSSVAVSNWGTVATGVVNESLTLLPGTAAFSDAMAQSNKTVTATGYRLGDGTGGLARNYELTSTVSTTAATIDPKAVTVTGTARATTYDAVSIYADLVNTTGFVASGLAQGDWVSSVNKALGGSGVSSGGVAQAGTYTVTPGNAAMGAGSASNYSFSYVAATNVVDKANLSVTATPSLTGNVYRGTSYTGTYTTTALGNDASALTVTGVATGTNAGTYGSTLAVSGAVLSNYNTPVITDANLVISPKPVTVTNTARSTTYD
ncbi:MAG: hypothetical protein EBT33_18930, partial [Betaproteobacteria bacterium]|nr:hypothetical protein [Betaproteobacteria bacterium]